MANLHLFIKSKAYLTDTQKLAFTFKTEAKFCDLLVSSSSKHHFCQFHGHNTERLFL